MGDLDISLIREFASRPGFYDRNNAYYKDKEFTEQAWEEISNNLGYEAPLLKDRMLQLRNRYNLEKRRIENLNAENPHKIIRSPWPLFQHLAFLSNHIRSRRSYKTMMTRSTSRQKLDGPMGAAEMAMAMGSHHLASVTDTDHQYAYNNGHIDVKNEMGSEAESDSQPWGNGFGDASAYLAETPDTEMQGGNGDGGSDDSPIITSPNVKPPMTRIHAGVSSGSGIAVRSMAALKRTYPAAAPMPMPMQKKKRRFEGRADKYEAFGRFLATSLCDLPEKKALVLIEKFTSDLVQSLIGTTMNDADEEKATEPMSHHEVDNEEDEDQNVHEIS